MKILLGLILCASVSAPASQDSDAQEYQRCSAKCNSELVKCYWEKPADDPGGKCDAQWDKCNVKCRPKSQKNHATQDQTTP
jgi:hypothetical protein